MPRTVDLAKILEDLENSNPQLRLLDLNFQDLTRNESTRLANALKRNNILTSLGLAGNDIDHEGIAALAAALEINTTLTALTIFSNPISDAMTDVFAAALEKNKTITYLSLRSTGIENNGAAALAKALKYNSTLTELNISDNQFGDPGAIALSITLQNNNTLSYLSIYGCYKIGDEGIAAIKSAIKKSTTLILALFTARYNSPENKPLIPFLNRNEKLAIQKESNLIKAAIVLINGRQTSNCFARIPFDILKKIFSHAGSGRMTAKAIDEMMCDVSTHTNKRKNSQSSEKWMLTKWLMPKTGQRLKLVYIPKDNPVYNIPKLKPIDGEIKKDKSIVLPSCEKKPTL